MKDEQNNSIVNYSPQEDEEVKVSHSESGDFNLGMFMGNYRVLAQNDFAPTATAQPQDLKKGWFKQAFSCCFSKKVNKVNVPVLDGSLIDDSYNDSGFIDPFKQHAFEEHTVNEYLVSSGSQTLSGNASLHIHE